MPGDIQPRSPFSADVTLATSDYEPVRLAGIWEHTPPPMQDFAFLALSMSTLEVPLKAVPFFRIDAGTTSAKSNYKFPVVKIEDDYTDLAEVGLVQIVRKRKFSSERQVQVWVPRRVDPLCLHPPIVQAVGSFMEVVGADWHPDSLEETDINTNFVTYKATVPRQELRLKLGGPDRIVRTTALAAAAMRLAVAETILTQDKREALDRYLKANPDARLIRGGE